MLYPKKAFPSYNEESEVSMNDFASYNGGKEPKTQEEWIDEAQKVAGSMKGKSEGDILKTIYARAAEGKRNGTLTNEEIDAFYRQFSPMLDAGKRKRLQKLVEELKRM